MRGAVRRLRLEHADEAGLLLEQRRHVVVERALRHEVGHEGRPRLADAVDAVLRLPVVGGHPVEVVEDDVRAGGERQPDARGHEVAQQHAHVGVLLEGVGCGLALRQRRWRR